MAGISRREKFFDYSLDMLCVANFEGYFVDVNLAFSRVLGYSREQLLCQPYLTFVHPDDVPATSHENSLVESGSQTQLHFENRYRHRDGHYLTLSWSSITDREAGLVYGIARDVTLSVNVRNRLLQIERALEQEALVVVTDPAGKITSANDAVCAATEYARGELQGRWYGDFREQVKVTPGLAKLQRDLSTLKVTSGLVETRTKSGERLAVQLLATPLFDHEGHVSGFLAVGQDSTSGVRNEEDLARTIKILNETNSIARVGGWELDIATGELEWTDETFRILEVEKKVGRKPMLPEGLKLFTPACQPIIERAVSRAAELGEPYSLEIQAQTAKGNVLWVYTNGKPNYRDGRIVTLSGTIQDIDARKTAELRYESERRAVLRQAKMASLGELSAAMAHELNNPLAIVAGAAELSLEEPHLPEPIRENLDDILKSCDRMAHIVGNLRRFSRTDESQQLRREHRLSSILDESIFLVAPRVKRERVQLHVAEPSSTTLSCCAIELEQVLVNLLNNAIDAVKSLNERWIRIAVVEREREIVVRVIDSGAGVPPSFLDDVFTPFRTTKAAGEGTGLGLAISRQIVQEHGGTLEYHRHDGHTCFEVTLPNEQSRASSAS